MTQENTANTPTATADAATKVFANGRLYEGTPGRQCCVYCRDAANCPVYGVGLYCRIAWKKRALAAAEISRATGVPTTADEFPKDARVHLHHFVLDGEGHFVRAPGGWLRLHDGANGRAVATPPAHGPRAARAALRPQKSLLAEGTVRLDAARERTAMDRKLACLSGPRASVELHEAPLRTPAKRAALPMLHKDKLPWLKSEELRAKAALLPEGKLDLMATLEKNEKGPLTYSEKIRTTLAIQLTRGLSLHTTLSAYRDFLIAELGEQLANSVPLPDVASLCRIRAEFAARAKLNAVDTLARDGEWALGHDGSRSRGHDLLAIVALTETRRILLGVVPVVDRSGSGEAREIYEVLTDIANLCKKTEKYARAAPTLLEFAAIMADHTAKTSKMAAVLAELVGKKTITEALAEKLAALRSANAVGSKHGATAAPAAAPAPPAKRARRAVAAGRNSTAVRDGTTASDGTAVSNGVAESDNAVPRSAYAEWLRIQRRAEAAGRTAAEAHVPPVAAVAARLCADTRLPVHERKLLADAYCVMHDGALVETHAVKALRELWHAGGEAPLDPEALVEYSSERANRCAISYLWHVAKMLAPRVNTEGTAAREFARFFAARHAGVATPLRKFDTGRLFASTHAAATILRIQEDVRAFLLPRRKGKATPWTVDFLLHCMDDATVQSELRVLAALGAGFGDHFTATFAHVMLGSAPVYVAQALAQLRCLASALPDTDALFALWNGENAKFEAESRARYAVLPPLQHDDTVRWCAALHAGANELEKVAAQFFPGGVLAHVPEALRLLLATNLAVESVFGALKIRDTHMAHKKVGALEEELLVHDAVRRGGRTALAVPKEAAVLARHEARSVSVKKKASKDALLAREDAVRNAVAQHEADATARVLALEARVKEMGGLCARTRAKLEAYTTLQLRDLLALGKVRGHCTVVGASAMKKAQLVDALLNVDWTKRSDAADGDAATGDAEACARAARRRFTATGRHGDRANAVSVSVRAHVETERRARVAAAAVLHAPAPVPPACPPVPPARPPRVRTRLRDSEEYVGEGPDNVGWLPPTRKRARRARTFGDEFVSDIDDLE